MTQAELFQALKSLGLPVAYGQFSNTNGQTVPAPPYIVYQFVYGSDMMADNRNHVSVENYQVELYTNRKDPASEALLQNKLKELRLPYSKTEQRIEEEKLYQIVFDIQLIGG